LESVCRGNSTVGSNPTLSASSLTLIAATLVACEPVPAQPPASAGDSLKPIALAVLPFSPLGMT
jgi:hypothetical protein